MGLGPSLYAEFPDRARIYGLVPYDVTHRLVINYVYDLPKIGTRMGSKALGVILDNWALSGITNFVSGLPYTPYMETPAQDLTGSNDVARINVISDPYLPKDERTFSRQFKTEAFAMPDPCSAMNRTLACFGNAGVNILRGPGVNNWDISLAKRIPVGLGDDRALQFRLETYNTWNHTQFSGIDSKATYQFGTQQNKNFGALNAGRSPRIMQFSLRFEF
jgi:hypothetical protein